MTIIARHFTVDLPESQEIEVTMECVEGCRAKLMGMTEGTWSCHRAYGVPSLRVFAEPQVHGRIAGGPRRS